MGRDAALQSTTHRAAPTTTKNHPAQTVKRAKLEKPWTQRKAFVGTGNVMTRLNVDPWTALWVLVGLGGLIGS